MATTDSVRLIGCERFGAWCWAAVRSAAVANAAPGQYLALRCAAAGRWDPLPREPLFVAAADRRAGTAQLLLPGTHPAAAFLETLAPGAPLDVLGPAGHGWNAGGSVRTLLLAGTAAHASALWGLAHSAVGRGLAVSVLLGVDDRLPPPPPFLLPQATEYDTASGDHADEAALGMLTPALLSWADLVALALPPSSLAGARRRIQTARLQWRPGYAQALWLPPLACSNGACGVCAVPVRRANRLACVEGPVFDLRELEVE